MPRTRIERVPPSRWPGLARFIHRCNGEGAELRCLHSHAGPDAVAYADELRALGPDEARFLAARDTVGALVGVIGAEFDAGSGRAWLRGPFVAGRRPFAPLAARLLQALAAALPAGIVQHDAFAGAGCAEALAFYRAQGFEADAGDDELFAASPLRSAAVPRLLLRAPTSQSRPAMSALHDSEFPRAYLPAARLFARQPADRVTRVALLDGTAVGYIHAHFDAQWQEGYVDFIAVGPAARGRGIGRVLLAAADRWARERHRARGLTLTVRADRMQARALYLSMGFVQVRSGIGLRRLSGDAGHRQPA